MDIEREIDALLAANKPAGDWESPGLYERLGRLPTVKETVQAVLGDHVYAYAWVGTLLGIAVEEHEEHAAVLRAVARAVILSRR